MEIIEYTPDCTDYPAALRVFWLLYIHYLPEWEIV